MIGKKSLLGPTANLIPGRQMSSQLSPGKNRVLAEKLVMLHRRSS
jgi:hypothetical protein